MRYEQLFQPRKRLSKRRRFLIMKYYMWKCAMFKCKITYNKKYSEEWGVALGHIDHIHPYSKRETYNGDINEIFNLQVLCESCNLKKKDKIYYLSEAEQ